MSLSNPRVLDLVATANLPAGYVAAAWQNVNSAVYVRSMGAGLISKLGIHVTTQSGNIALAVYRGVGAGRLRVPVDRLATTGTFACPAAGYVETALDVPVYVTENDYLAMSCDNTTAAVYGTSANISALSLGFSFVQATAHPLPATAGSLSGTSFRLPVIVGAA